MIRLLLLLALAFNCTQTLADEYPERSVRFVVGFGPGGPTDVIARIVAQDLTASMGQAFLVDNRPAPTPSSPRSSWRTRRPTATPCSSPRSRCW